MKKIKAIIFDLDGTLLDTIGDIAAALEYVLSENGLPSHELNEYKMFIGSGAKNLVRKAAGDVSEELFEKLYKEYRQRYAEYSEVLTKPFDGVTEVLEALAKKYKLAILSNKPHTDTLPLAKKYFPTVAFDTVQGQIPEMPIKPDPALALKIADGMGVLPEEVVFVGDGTTDIQTAINAKMIPVAVTWGYRTKEQLQQVGAEIFAETVSDLENMEETVNNGK